MLNAEKILKFAEEQNYSEIINLCRLEIISNETKKTGGVKLEMSRKAFNKYLKSCQKVQNSYLRYYALGEIQDYGRCQIACNAYTAVCMFGKPFADGEFIQPLPKELTYLNVDQCFPENWKGFPVVSEISQKDIRVAYKLTVQNSKKQRIVLFENGAYFDLCLAKELFDILGDCKVYMSNQPTNAAVCLSDIGIGLLLPLRTPKDYQSIKSFKETLA